MCDQQSPEKQGAPSAQESFPSWMSRVRTPCPAPSRRASKNGTGSMLAGVHSLYEHALGPAWGSLPEPVRRCHLPGLVASGRFKITHTRSWLGRLVIAIMGMPRSGEDVQTDLRVAARERHQAQYQEWVRHFDGRPMTTEQYALDRRVAERMGSIELAFDVVASGDALEYVQRGARFCLLRLRIPLPAWCAPRVHARCWAEPHATAMNVRVRIALPMLGELVTYGGALEPTGRQG